MYTLQLEESQVEIIAKYLRKGPYDEVVGVLSDISAQIQAYEFAAKQAELRHAANSLQAAIDSEEAQTSALADAAE